MKFRLGLLLTLPLWFSCETTDPLLPPPNEYSRSIELTSEYVGVTELWLRVRFVDSASSRSFELYRDTTLVYSSTLVARDTVVMDEQVNPNQTFDYKAFRIENGVRVDTSNVIAMTTDDSSSSNWSAVIDTLGSPSSILFDVCILDDSSYLAVGELSDPDTLTGYGSAYWNGVNWQLRRIVTDCGTGPTNVVRVTGVSAYSNQSIWFAVGSVVQWNGTINICHPIRGTILSGDETVDKIYAASPNQVFGVGSLGTTVLFNGTWQRLPSNSSAYLTDVHGSSGNDVYAVGENPTTQVSDLLRYDGTSWSKILTGQYPGAGFDTTELFETQLLGGLSGVWSPEREHVFVAGDRVYEYRHGYWRFLPGLQDNDLSYPTFSRGYLADISGNGPNDFFFVGERSTLYHFNGVRAKQVGIPFDFSSSIDLRGVDVRGNLAVAVGNVGNKGVTVRLYR